jgi:hypothetical protein
MRGLEEQSPKGSDHGIPIPHLGIASGLPPSGCLYAKRRDAFLEYFLGFIAGTYKSSSQGWCYCARRTMCLFHLLPLRLA